MRNDRATHHGDVHNTTTTISTTTITNGEAVVVDNNDVLLSTSTSSSLSSNRRSKMRRSYHHHHHHHDTSSSLLQQALLSPSVAHELEQEQQQQCGLPIPNSTNDSDNNIGIGNSFMETSFSWKAILPWSFAIMKGRNTTMTAAATATSTATRRHQRQRSHVSIHRRQHIRPQRILDNFNNINNTSIDEGDENDDDDDEEEVDGVEIGVDSDDDDAPPHDDDDDTTATENDSALYQCYYYASFFFRTYRYQQQQQPRDKNSTSILIILLVLSIWCLGIYTSKHIYDYSVTNSDTTVFSLLQATPMHNNIHKTPSKIAHDAFQRAYSGSDNSKKNDHHFVNAYPSTPLILVIRHTASTNTTTTTTKSTVSKAETSTSMTAVRKPTYQTTTISRSATSQPINHNTLFYQQGRDYVNGLQSFLNSSNTSLDTDSIRISSYFNYVDDGLYWYARSSMATPDGTSILVHVDYNCRTATTTKPSENTTTSVLLSSKNVERYNCNLFHRNLMNAIDVYTNQFYTQFVNQSSSLCIHIDRTGIPYVEVGYVTMMQQFIQTLLVSFVPTSILLFSFIMWYLYQINLFTIWIVPVITIFTSLSVESVLVYYVVRPHYPDILSMATLVFIILMTLVESVVQLFILLSRYLEEWNNNKSSETHTSRANSTQYMQYVKDRCIHRMLVSSGSTILSTSIISIIILFIIIITTSTIIVQSIMTGIIITTSTATIIHLVMIPILLRQISIEKFPIHSADDLIPSTQSGMISQNLDDMLPGHLRENVNESRNDDDDEGESESLNVQERQDAVSPSSNLMRLSNNSDVLAESFSAQLLPTPRKSIWFSIARKCVHPYYGIIILLVISQILGPISYNAKRIKLSLQLTDLLSSKGSTTVESYDEFSNQIGKGRLYPFRILFDGHSTNVSMTSKVGFEAMHLVLIEMQSITLLHRTGIAQNHLSDAFWTEYEYSDNNEDFFTKFYRYVSLPVGTERKLFAPQLKYNMLNGIAIIQNTFVSYDMFLTAKYCAPPSRKKKFCPFEFFRMIAATNDAVTSDDTYATYIQVELGVDPFSPSGIEWLAKARHTIDRLRQEKRLSGIEVNIDGLTGLVYDDVNSTYNQFHRTIAICAIVVAVMHMILFGSVVISLRVIATTSLTILVSLGLTVLVYQEGMMNWTKMASQPAKTFDSNNGSWLFPILSVPIVIGLTLRFESLLTSRILEYRTRGYEHKSSFALGFDSVGNNISLAAILVAFLTSAPLLFSKCRLLHQWSLLVTTAVIIDTCVVRLVIVPITIGLFKSCWWPRRLPEEKFCLEEFNLLNPLRAGGGSNEVDGGNYWETLINSSEYEPLSRYR